MRWDYDECQRSFNCFCSQLWVMFYGSVVRKNEDEKPFFLHKKPFQTSTGPDCSSSLNLNVNLLSLKPKVLFTQFHAQALFNNKPVLVDCPDFNLNYWWILITSVVAALFHRNRLFKIYYRQTSPHLTLTCFQQGFLSTYISQTLLPITIFTMRGCNTKQICFPSFSWY